jgi:hypothetical protein
MGPPRRWPFFLRLRRMNAILPPICVILPTIRTTLTRIQRTLPEIYPMLPEMWATLTRMGRMVSGSASPLSLLHFSPKSTGWRLTLSPRNVPSWECLLSAPRST